VLLAFATARVPGLSLTLSLTALVSFLAGAVLGGRMMARAIGGAHFRIAAQVFLLEVAVLTAASVCAIGYQGHVVEPSVQPLALIALTALALGARNAAVRKLAIPDLTTTVLTLTLTGIAADSSLANGNNVRLAEKNWRGPGDVCRRRVGRGRRRLLRCSGVGGCRRNRRGVQCGIVSVATDVRCALRGPPPIGEMMTRLCRRASAAAIREDRRRP
jgi:hypothetical protein